MPRDADKAELLRTLRVHATRRVAQHARAAATALEEGGCDGMVRFIAALAGYGEAGALGARDRDEATIAYRGGVLVRTGLRPIGATVARQIPVLKVTRSNRVSVTG